MRTIWKFDAVIDDTFTLDMPGGSKVLCVQTQKDKPQIWAEVTPGAAMVKRTFYWVGTGHPMDRIGGGARYIGTVQLYAGTLVFHLYEEAA